MEVTFAMDHLVLEGMPSLLIPYVDYDTLHRVASCVREQGPRSAPAAFLAAELDRADVVMSEVLPRNVVTMHARVEYRNDVTDQVGRLTLVYPDEDRWNEGCVSVLSPLGAAVLGLSEGQSIRWRTPSGGARGVTVLRVLFQPHPVSPGRSGGV